MYIYIHNIHFSIYQYIGGWGAEINREIVSFRFVRACARSCM